MPAKKLKAPRGMAHITKTQIQAIKMAADILSSSMGVGNPKYDNECAFIVRNVDRFLRSNGDKRDYN